MLKLGRMGTSTLYNCINCTICISLSVQLFYFMGLISTIIIILRV